MLRSWRPASCCGAMLFVLLVSASLVEPAVARTANTATITVSGGTRVAEPDKWWGVAGAALCGVGIRVIRVAPEIGMNPYVLAATIGGCILAALDQL